MKQDIYHRPIDQHGGSKYVRIISDVDGEHEARVDVYSVLKAFGVACPAIQQAVKKLLCAGLRGKGGRVQDLKEAMDALFRGIQFAEDDAFVPPEPRQDEGQAEYERRSLVAEAVHLMPRKTPGPGVKVAPELTDAPPGPPETRKAFAQRYEEPLPKECTDPKEYD